MVTVICPECGYPYEDNTYVVAERSVTCANCRWSGSSANLLQVRGELQGGVDTLQQLYLFLGKNITPQIGVKMMELGLLCREGSVENVSHVAHTLVTISRATFKTILELVTKEEEGSRDGTVH